MVKNNEADGARVNRVINKIDETKIRSVRLRLFGHIARAEPPPELGSLVREPPTSTWSRPRGRPRRTWTDLLAADLQAAGLDITTAWVAARDRKTSRAVCRGATPSGGACGAE
ncbi:hypothetical protein Bbelb_025090 [Branchiostoma belcheri]|nr:hypothetical protein Bbelb_025090 [Branchiostoma belcheri]